MKNVLKKLFEAKQIIKNTKIKKEGKNDFSKYSYFTPSQISELISDACSQTNCVTKFDLIRNELGIFGKLYFIDCDSSEQIEFEMASAIPEIKATNIAQQLGGAVTYTHRYLLTTAFDIVDNSLDFDTTENTKNQSKPATTTNDLPWLNKDTDTFAKCRTAISSGQYTIADIKKKYKISKEVETLLTQN